MKQRFYTFMATMFVALLLVSCNLMSPASSGRPFEVLVVANTETQQKAIDNALETYVEGLPQPELSFRLMHTNMQGYDSTMKLVRNIVIADVQDIYTTTKVKVAKNTYANHQIILTIQSPSDSELATYVAKNSDKLVEYINKAEIDRQVAVLKKDHSQVALHLTDSLFGCKVLLPKDFISTKKAKDFLWIGTKSTSSERFFIMYSYPYSTTDVFTKEYFVSKRDSVLKENIPGGVEGSYMKTDSAFTAVRNTTVQGKYAMEAKGLWNMAGDFMGGPYVSHIRVDTVNNRIVTAEVFIYAPEKSKRNLVKQMEASLYTVELPATEANVQKKK